MKTQIQLRAAFWAAHPQFKRVPNLTQNYYSATVRSAWVDFVDAQARDGNITDSLARRATL